MFGWITWSNSVVACSRHVSQLCSTKCCKSHYVHSTYVIVHFKSPHIKSICPEFSMKIQCVRHKNREAIFICLVKRGPINGVVQFSLTQHVVTSCLILFPCFSCLSQTISWCFNIRLVCMPTTPLPIVPEISGFSRLLRCFNLLTNAIATTHFEDRCETNNALFVFSRQAWTSYWNPALHNVSFTLTLQCNGGDKYVNWNIYSDLSLPLHSAHIYVV